MTRGSVARQRREMHRVGVAITHRILLPAGAAVEHIETAIIDAYDELARRGVRLNVDTVIMTTGVHPDFPGKITVEAKAASVSG